MKSSSLRHVWQMACFIGVAHFLAVVGTALIWAMPTAVNLFLERAFFSEADLNAALSTTDAMIIVLIFAVALVMSLVDDLFSVFNSRLARVIGTRVDVVETANIAGFAKSLELAGKGDAIVYNLMKSQQQQHPMPTRASR